MKDQRDEEDESVWSLFSSALLGLGLGFLVTVAAIVAVALFRKLIE